MTCAWGSDRPAVQDVADHRAGGRCDHADHARQERQGLFARGIEQAFGFKPRLQFGQQRQQRAFAGDFHAVDHDLVIRAAGIGRQLAGGDDLDAVFGAEA
jgi:hypothetical protein